MDIEKEIRDITEQLLEEEQYRGYFLLEVESGKSKYVVYIDGDEGVDFEILRQISRRLEEVMDADPKVAEDYTLEVSSPGVSRPMTMWRQYPKHIGRKLKVRLKDGSEVKATLDEVGEDILFLSRKKKKKETKTYEIPFAEIQDSVVQISFK